ncbi:hypothetical protein B0T16DRAFT_425454 [Cercophora newfieldiana]|uniref:Elongin-A n=1 Tax=Cercophora newfieldiana TaxID=92897 RepID=A0AA39YR44_9PEZI|nr:hypothetical protein B0T16DRAFT_425454 [Cercophora newfieldiana]
MAPLSLVEMCKKVASDNIHLIHGFGVMPAQLVSDILRAVRSADHLHELELHSEDIYEETPQHWRRIIAKDFPRLSREHQWVPSNPKSWYKVWKKYKAIHDESVAAATALLEKTFTEQQKAKDSKRTQLVTVEEARRLNLPKFGSGVLRAPHGSGSPGSHWSAQPPRPKATPLAKVRTQVKAEAKRLRLATPTGRLPVTPGQVTKAPESFIRDKRVERRFDPASTLVRAPGRPSSIGTAEIAREKARKEREERLLRIKGTSKHTEEPTENLLSFDDDDDREGGSSGGNNRGVLGDLFGELEAKAASPPSLTSTAIPGPSTTKPRRRGLLSAAPGSTSLVKVTRTATTSPTTSTSPPPTNTTLPPPKTSSPPTKHLSRPEASPSPPPPPHTSPPQALRPPKRKEVDIFMRPKKRVRK